MKSLKTHMDESILVCVYYGPNGERLIRREVDFPRCWIVPLYTNCHSSVPGRTGCGENGLYFEMARTCKRTWCRRIYNQRK